MRLSLNAKIALAIAGPALSGLMIAALSANGFSNGKARIEAFAERNQAKKNWSAVRVLQMELALKERNYIGERRADARKSLAATMDGDRREIDEIVAKLLETMRDGDKEDAAAYLKSFHAWWDVDEEIRKEVDQGRPDFAFAKAIDQGAGQARDAFDAALKIAASGSEHEIQATLQGLAASNSKYSSVIWVLEALMILGGVVVAMGLTRTVRRCLDLIANGLAMNSHDVERAATQVAEAASKLSQASTEQAASLQQTAASSEELTAMVVRNQESAQQATMLTESNQSTAQKGQQVVQDMATAITEINLSNQEIMTEVFESNRKISEITKVIAEIGDKTKVINDIVFQTKLLSFNASVEAARAGEHGRGFAVVAEEIGNLAAMSGNAAKEIGDMLESSVQKVESIVHETRTNVERLVLQGKEKVETGTRIVGECSTVLDEIVTSVTQVSMMSRDISVASEEQARGVKEISNAVNQLDSVVHGNATTAEQAARAAETLNSQAKTMQTTVQELMSYLTGSAASDAVRWSETARSGQERTKAVFSAMKTKNAALNVRSIDTASQTKPKVEAVVPSPKSVGSESASAAKAVAVLKPSSKSATAKSQAETKKKRKAQAPKASPAAPTGEQVEAKPLKLAAGAESQIPSADDPRFKDI